jgi:hypothetical protein
MTVQGHRIRVKTINLTAPSGAFEEDLRAIVERTTQDSQLSC